MLNANNTNYSNFKNYFQSQAFDRLPATDETLIAYLAMNTSQHNYFRQLMKFFP